MPGLIGLRGRTARRVLVLSSLTFLLALVFGAGLVVSQGRVLMPWSTNTNGGADLTSLRHKMRAVAVGQSAMGVASSDEYELELGFHTGVRAGPSAFASLAAELALTPTTTPEPETTNTPTPEPTETPAQPTEEAAVPTETPEATSTATPTLVPTVPPKPTATATGLPRPSATMVPKATPTSEPIVIVVTSPPRPSSPTPEPPAAAPAVPPTPLVIVVTSVPPSAPVTPESPVGGLCSASGSRGPLPIDLGLLMIMAAPLALWRFRSRS